MLDEEAFVDSSSPCRRTYLITYSQIDVKKFPTRESFADVIVKVFNQTTAKSKITTYAVCMEPHKDGGDHYHMCIKLSGPRRWKGVKTELLRDYKISVHFSDRHTDYYTAYKYVTKSDKNVVKSEGHPDLDAIGSPVTKKCMNAYREKSLKRKSTECVKTSEISQSKKSNKTQRFTHYDVTKFIRKNNIRNENQLFCAAKQREEQGMNDLAQFVINVTKNQKSRNDLISAAWKLEDSVAIQERKKTSRMQLLRDTLKTECVEGCNAQWLACSKEVISNNGFHPYVFAAALRDLFQQGRGKFRNIILTGPTNCGKTFLFSPLEKIFNVFVNPSLSKFAWIIADQAEAILLNNLRWSSDFISWKDFLLLLEGQTVHLPAPMNHYAQDVCINTDVPILATSKDIVKYVGRFNATDDMETDMMASRWKVFKFYKQIPQSEQRNIPACPHCFAELFFLGEIVS